jgi:hypothetical protein
MISTIFGLCSLLEEREVRGGGLPDPWDVLCYDTVEREGYYVLNFP